MHNVFGAIGSARHHKEGGGDQGPKREANEFLPIGYGGEGLGTLELLSASCCQFLWLPPQATHSHHRVSLESSSLRRRHFVRGSQVGCVFPGISAKLVRSCEITGNFHRCKIFLQEFANSYTADGVGRG